MNIPAEREFYKGVKEFKMHNITTEKSVLKLIDKYNYSKYAEEWI